MLQRLIAKVSNLVDGFDTNHFLILAACAVVIGFFCLRGFGSRKSY